MDEIKTYDFECPLCPFTSTGWQRKSDADLRAKQHKAEHDSGDAMPELAAMHADTDKDA